MNLELARQLAAQFWCAPTTSHLVMEPALAEVIAHQLMTLHDEIDRLHRTPALKVRQAMESGATIDLTLRLSNNDIVEILGAHVDKVTVHGPKFNDLIKTAFYNGSLGEPWPTGKLVATTKFKEPITVTSGETLRIKGVYVRGEPEHESKRMVQIQGFRTPQDFFIDDITLEEWDAQPVSLDTEGPAPLIEVDGKIKEVADWMTRGNLMPIEESVQGQINAQFKPEQGTTTFMGYIPPEETITCRCLGCKVEGQGGTSMLQGVGWSDIESDPDNVGKFVGVCMRDACRTRFGLTIIKGNETGVIGGDL